MASIRDTHSRAERARLSARPVPFVAQKDIPHDIPRGVLTLPLEDARETLLYIPPQYQGTTPLPFVLMLHGAGGNARGGMTPFVPAANLAGLILLAPSSHDQTWDAIMHTYGRDVRSIDRALDYVFKTYAIDPSHLAIGGFSDGASYALSLGLTNGDLFTHIIAFSPGFMVPASRHGTPRIYISHGRRDAVLPIEQCSRRIVPQLKREQYDVHYREFDGPHTVPVEIVRDAWEWFSES